MIPIASLHRGVIQAVDYAQGLCRDLTAVHIELDPGSGETLQQSWLSWFPGIPLVVLPSPYRSTIGPLLEFLDQTDREHNDGQQAILILPEFVPARWWQAFLHNQTAWVIKAAVLYHRRASGSSRIVVDVPYRLPR